MTQPPSTAAAQPPLWRQLQAVSQVVSQVVSLQVVSLQVVSLQNKRHFVLQLKQLMMLICKQYM